MLGILVGVLFTFLFGGMLLIVVLGASGIQDELEKRTHLEPDARARAAAIPRFFVLTQPGEVREGHLDEALVGQLQQYLEAEQTLAAEFVSQPSMESLYRESGKPLLH